MKIERPDDVEVTLTITMTTKDWCEINDQLCGRWPSWKLSAAITSMLSQVRKIVFDETELNQ